ncbi:MAG: acyl-CoA dehydrogenase family protein [Alphaproteobacteria bacterium]|nr:acyl-CoA dehydrogenase family protein [Alphaproteobacteria bacterium]
MQTDQIIADLQQVAAKFAGQRTERLARTHLERADFDLLAQAGFLKTGLAAKDGGVWRDVPRSTRPYAEMIRTIAMGDPSVALVAAMHPCVLAIWYAAGEPPAELTGAWRAQCDWVFGTVKNGAWWGTVTSEPGSGGDIMKTRAVAKPTGDAGRYLISGEKHFGSGAGISKYMFTTAIAMGESIPDVFILGVGDAKWDGTQGITLAAEWDGHGMSATQSHAFTFNDFPAIRNAWPGAMMGSVASATQLGGCLFTAVIVAVVEQALTYARKKLAAKSGDMRPYERVEWVRAENEGWLIRQAYDGMLNAVENGAGGIAATARGKATVAELAETCLGRISRVVGGASFSRASPLGRWAQDVRALGFLRPPWGLAYDQLFGLSWVK